MAFNVNADLFRIASAWMSKDETRYYLKGVHIQPHPVQGAFLVSTDGHGLIVIHDTTAIVDKAVTVKLSTDAMKACKAKPRETGERRLSGDEASKPVTISFNDAPMALSHDWLIDGHYPDWQRVVPSSISGKAASFSAAYIERMAKIAGELAAVDGLKLGDMSILHNDQAPALVKFGYERAFAVLMPKRAADHVTEAALPAWLNEAPAMAVAAE